MDIPFVCDKCEDEKYFSSTKAKRDCGCGGEMFIDYRDNFEQDHEAAICNTCINYRVGGGEKCSFCSNI